MVPFFFFFLTTPKTTRRINASKFRVHLQSKSGMDDGKSIRMILREKLSDERYSASGNINDDPIQVFIQKIANETSSEILNFYSPANMDYEFRINISEVSYKEGSLIIEFMVTLSESLEGFIFLRGALEMFSFNLENEFEHLLNRFGIKVSVTKKSFKVFVGSKKKSRFSKTIRKATVKSAFYLLLFLVAFAIVKMTDYRSEQNQAEERRVIVDQIKKELQEKYASDTTNTKSKFVDN